MSRSSGWICRKDYKENVMRSVSARHCEFTAEDLWDGGAEEVLQDPNLLVDLARPFRVCKVHPIVFDFCD